MGELAIIDEGQIGTSARKSLIKDRHQSSTGLLKKGEYIQFERNAEV